MPITKVTSEILQCKLYRGEQHWYDCHLRPTGSTVVDIVDSVASGSIGPLAAAVYQTTQKEHSLSEYDWTSREFT